MDRKTPKGKSATFMAFNVTYEDGRMTSNRRVSSEFLDQTFGASLEDLARQAIEDQDAEIAKRAGQSRGKIKSVVRA